MHVVHVSPDDDISVKVDFDGDLHELPESVELYACGVEHVVEYPFRWKELLDRAVEVQEERQAAVLDA